MQYMLQFAEAPEHFVQRTDPAQAGSYWGAWNTYIGAMQAAGAMLSGAGLHGPHTATTVRLRDGHREVQDGPFADSKEQLAGFVLIEAPDLDTALDWAAQAPCAVGGAVEVRPVLPPPTAPGLPA